MVFTCQLVQDPLPPSTIIIAAEDTSRVRHPFELSEANCRRKAFCVCPKRIPCKGKGLMKQNFGRFCFPSSFFILFADLEPSAHHKICRVGKESGITTTSRNGLQIPLFHLFLTPKDPPQRHLKPIK